MENVTDMNINLNSSPFVFSFSVTMPSGQIEQIFKSFLGLKEAIIIEGTKKYFKVSGKGEIFNCSITREENESDEPELFCGIKCNVKVKELYNIIKMALFSKIGSFTEKGSLFLAKDFPLILLYNIPFIVSFNTFF